MVLVVLCALGSLALIEWPFRQDQRRPEQPVSGASGGAASPEATLGQFTALDPSRPAPALAFTERDGTPRQLADFRGHWVLVNLWATWCGPCIEEMPSLGRLQAALGDRLTILAISEDRGAAAAVDPFLNKLDIKALPIYLDPKGAAGQAFEVRGLPTSVLIDPLGRLVAKLEGKADWDAPATLAKLQAYLGRRETQG
jgi:thiol-disulfide isomerase/thioredoxin